jgi:RNA recognition motif-containing protein
LFFDLFCLFIGCDSLLFLVIFHNSHSCSAMNFVNTSLFIGDLPKFCNESDLEQLFAPYGPTLDVKVKRNVNTGKTLSYGFVTLSTEAYAAEAIRALDGALFSGRKLRVRWAMYNARTQNPISHGVINSVYVRFVTNKVNFFRLFIVIFLIH